MMNKLQTLNLLLAGLVFSSILLFPQFKIVDRLPYFQFIDLLVPVIGIVVFLQRKSLVFSKFYLWLIGFGMAILVSNLINYSNNGLRDYFEIYKVLKFGLVVALFSLVRFESFYKSWLKPVFITLVGVNLIHYFNLFDFNDIIKEYYNGGIHIDLFGLDSKGNVGTKRMLGLAGNPNVNAVVFLFFITLFFPHKGQVKQAIIWFVVALFMLFLCQSRTSLVGLVVMVGYAILSKKSTLKYYSLIGLILFTFLLSFLLSQNSYINTMFDKDVLENNSMMGRYEVWKYLGKMILDKPIFGYGAYKQYFYERNMYAESQYLLIFWRYGLVGLIAFLGLIFYPIYFAFKSKLNSKSFLLVLFTISITINSLTNAPVADRSTSILYAILLGFWLCHKKEKCV